MAVPQTAISDPPTPVPANATPSVAGTTTMLDQLVTDGKSMPGLIARFQNVFPDLAQRFTGKGLLTTRSTPVTVLVTVLAWLSTRYGLQWDDATCAFIAGVAMTLVSYGMRAITNTPVAGWFTGHTPVQAAVAIASKAAPLVLALMLAVGLSACAGGTTKINSNGTPVTVSENVAGSLYTTYNLADTAWLGYLTVTPNGAQKQAVVSAVQPSRLAVSAAVKAFAVAAVKGNAAAEQAAAQIALDAFVKALTAQGITVPTGSN